MAGTWRDGAPPTSLAKLAGKSQITLRVGRYASAKPAIAAGTSSAGGVVFAGELTGDFLVLDAATGAVKFRHCTGVRAADRFPGSATIMVIALPRR